MKDRTIIDATIIDEHSSTKNMEKKRDPEMHSAKYGDSACLGLQKRPEVAHDEHLSSINYRINLRPGSIPTVSDNAIDWTRWIEKRKSSVRRK